MNKKLYETFFKNKKITVMGLGVLGRGIQVTAFLAECGANLTVTDLKTKEELKNSIKALGKYKNIRYVLGRHELVDFQSADMVIKSAGVPLDSLYIAEARKNRIDIAMDASLFARIAKNIRLVGVTGTRGKSMTTALIYHILKSNEKKLGYKVHVGGNMRLKATLPLLKKVKDGDIVVLELDSWQCQGFGDEKFSPEIAAFTSFMPDHMNYYKDDMEKYLADKQNIFVYQNKDGVLIANKNIKIPSTYKGKIKLGNVNDVKGIPMHIIGQHNLENASYSYKVGECLGLNDKVIKKSLTSFKGLEGRLEYVGKKKGVHIINDNNATTPEATLAGVEAVLGAYKKSKIILIAGGADKKLALKSFNKAVGKCKSTIFLKGSGTDRLKGEFPNIVKIEVSNLKDAISKAFSLANKNDVVLFSPGFASFGMFKHEYDRNDQFLHIVRKVKSDC